VTDYASSFDSKILVHPLFAEFQTVILSGSLGFEDNTIEAFDKDRTLRSVSKNIALRALPIWRAGMDPQGVPNDKVAFGIRTMFPS
jgi:hypothetical protein